MEAARDLHGLPERLVADSHGAADLLNGCLDEWGSNLSIRVSRERLDTASVGYIQAPKTIYVAGAGAR